MKRFAMAVILIALGSAVRAQEQGATPKQPTRNPQEASDAARSFDEPMDDYGYSGTPKPKEVTMFGGQFLVYYDALANFYKTNASVSSINQLSYNSQVGMGGIQLLFAIPTKSRWEFSAGIDYSFPVNVQGQQMIAGSYVVNNQTFNIMGFKAIQVGYHIPAGQFTIVPYGGLGIYYGKNDLTLQNLAFGGTDEVIYSKLMADFIGGARIDYNFNSNHTFVAGVGFELFMPMKLADSLSQNGSTSASELPGDESILQSNMDFWTGVGGRVYANIGLYFY